MYHAARRGVHFDGPSRTAKWAAKAHAFAATIDASPITITRRCPARSATQPKSRFPNTRAASIAAVNVASARTESVSTRRAWTAERHDEDHGHHGRDGRAGRWPGEKKRGERDARDRQPLPDGEAQHGRAGRPGRQAPHQEGGGEGTERDDGGDESDDGVARTEGRREARQDGPDGRERLRQDEHGIVGAEDENVPTGTPLPARGGQKSV